MKRVLALVLIMAIGLVSIAGCGGAGEDFKLYDKSGKVVQDPEEEETGLVVAKEGEYTSRKIGIGSTEEEFKRAYGDILDKAEVEDVPDGSGTAYVWKMDGKTLMIGVHDGKVIGSSIIIDEKYNKFMEEVLG